jgi:hypothetical protein
MKLDWWMTTFAIWRAHPAVGNQARICRDDAATASHFVQNTSTAHVFAL